MLAEAGGSMKSVIIVFAVGVASFLAIGCEESQPQASQTAPAAGAAALPADLFVATAPAGGTDVAALKASAKDGERVVVRGVVGGRTDPIAENRAVVTLLDPSIKTCDQTPGDKCTTPWDACCEPADVLAQNSITVQVVDSSGAPLKTGLGSKLTPLSVITVAGTLRTPAEGVVLVDASSIHVGEKRK
jgi:hypothetical protein